MDKKCVGCKYRVFAKVEDNDYGILCPRCAKVKENSK